MCEITQSVRTALFLISGGMILAGVLLAHQFCNRHGINMNTLPGMFEMYRRVFKFENKLFSLLVLICMYGSAMLILMCFILTAWGLAQGCDFPIARNKPW